MVYMKRLLIGKSRTFFWGRDKRGNIIYENLFPLIIGLIVLFISLYWIFSSYFTEDDLNWEVCRESLIIRNTLPEKDLGVLISSKGLLDLKCSTNEITIDYEDTERAEREIANVMASFWYMVGRGEYRVFPGASSVFGSADTPCMIPARIHLDREVREFYSEDDNRINLEDALNLKVEGNEFTVLDYLSSSTNSNAFSYFKEWNDTGFFIDYNKEFLRINLENVQAFILPRYLDVEKGDLFIGYAEPVKEASFSDERSIQPYIFLIQYNDFEKLSEYWILYEGGLRSKVCSSIETVPA